MRIIFALWLGISFWISLALMADEASERAAYWKERGYDFDPSRLAAYQMDLRVADIERAAYWKKKGYDFDPNRLAAYQMDLRVAELDSTGTRSKVVSETQPPDKSTIGSTLSSYPGGAAKTVTTGPQTLTYPGQMPSDGKPSVAENGDIRGADNDGDGRVEPVHVRGYYRKDGTYVRGHYRARPRR